MFYLKLRETTEKLIGNQHIFKKNLINCCFYALVIVSIILTTTLIGCSTPAKAPVENRAQSQDLKKTNKRARRPLYYKVKKGDTLYSIAWQYGLDYKLLAKWNQIDASYVIFVGQKLRLASNPNQTINIGQQYSYKKSTYKKKVYKNNSVKQRNKINNRPVIHNKNDLKKVATTKNNNKANSQKTNNKSSKKSSTQKKNTKLGGSVKTAKRPNRQNNNKNLKGSSKTTVNKTVANKKVGRTPSKKNSHSNNKNISITQSGSKTNQSWLWPIKGKIIQRFVPAKGEKGIDIAVDHGIPVKATKDGQVVYSGHGLKGYGFLVIIKHNEEFLSAYAHNSRLTVKGDEKVKQGQVIAYSGKTATDRVKLHFEIRKNGNPVNPLSYLPKL